MSGGEPAGRLGRRIARLLRAGTLLAVAAVGAGLVVALAAGGSGPGARPVIELLGSGGADALIAGGLLALTLLPLGVLGMAAVTFGADGERRYLVTSLAALALLVGTLAVAAFVAGAS